MEGLGVMVAKTGWPPGLLQDDCRALSKWLAGRLGARQQIKENTMNAEPMAYVAADPEQPGAAWACCVDDPHRTKDTAKELANWVRRGAQIMRVDIATARAMMAKWERPEKRPKARTQTALF